MKVEIKDGKFVITGDLQSPERSKSGKTFIVATTKGFISVPGLDGKQYSVSLNIITK